LSAERLEAQQPDGLDENALLVDALIRLDGSYQSGANLERWQVLCLAECRRRRILTVSRDYRSTRNTEEFSFVRGLLPRRQPA
jgi:hypothetical protein